MADLTLTTGICDCAPLRESFDALAAQVFGLAFGGWYRADSGPGGTSPTPSSTVTGGRQMSRSIQSRHVWPDGYGGTSSSER